MSVTERRESWTWDRYLDWEAGQELRHELVDGEVRAMTGGSQAHDRIANNLRAALWAQLRTGTCLPFGPDLKVKAGRNGRYPDALIDCGKRDRASVLAENPVAVFEVLSRSTAWVDHGMKLRDYDATTSVRHYVLVDQDMPRAMIYRRDESGRLSAAAMTIVEGLEAAVELADLGVVLPLGVIYERVDFGGLEFVGDTIGRPLSHEIVENVYDDGVYVRRNGRHLRITPNDLAEFWAQYLESR